MTIAPSTPSEASDDDDLSPFGDWLKQARDAKNWTQIDLADKTGISSQQISNLETGRTRNPQKRTREKLELALGSGPPQSVVFAEESLNTIVGLGQLVGFDPYDIDALPTEQGVYVFYDRTKRPVYVGRATKRSIGQRVQEHTEKFWFKAPVVQAAAYLAIPDEGLCKQTEQVLIKFMRTHLLLNKQGVEVESEDDVTEG